LPKLHKLLAMHSTLPLVSPYVALPQAFDVGDHSQMTHYPQIYNEGSILLRTAIGSFEIIEEAINFAVMINLNVFFDL
jgi:hypothetical protein